MSTPYNLDDGISEYFEFSVFGNTYRFRQPTTGEFRKLQTMADDDEATKNFLSEFITKVDEKAPDFVDVMDRFTLPHWKNFRVMINSEMGLDGSNSSTTGS